MNRFLVVLFVLFTTVLRSQTISGFVFDEESKEPLISALIHTGEHTALTDEYGRFIINGDVGASLTVNYLGYDDVEIVISHTALSIPMQISTNEIDAVTVVAEGETMRRRSPQMSLSSIDRAMIKSQPMILGEADVLKALQTLPGVKFGVEGSSGLYVRGGSSGQNLILLDDIPIYIPNHGFGFFSAIPSEIVKKVDLYKGGFPADYGNRLSSVVDVKAIDGDKSTRQTTLGISTIAAKLAHQGPIIKDKLACAVTGRYSLTGLFTPYAFYDGSVKLNYTPTNKHRFNFLFLNSGDAFNETKMGDGGSFKQNKKLIWNNTLTGLSWKYFANQKLSVDVRGYGSFYQVSSDHNREPLLPEISYIKSDFTSKITDLGLKTKLQYYLTTQSKIEYGNGITKFNSTPENSQYLEMGYNQQDTLSIGKTALAEQNSTLIHNYLKYQYDNGRFGINIGARLNHYINGDYKHISVEPRISLKYEIARHLIKASYSQVNQYSHYFTNDYLGNPTDSWLVADGNLSPSHSTQYAIGFSPYIKNKHWSVETEFYYKNIKDDIRQSPGHHFLSSSYYEKIGKVDGTSYGWETSVKYKASKFDINLAYTWSKTDREFQDKSIFDKKFPYRFDRRHDLTLTGNYLLSKKEKKNKTVSQKLSFDFVYASGAHYTLRNIMVYNPIPTIGGGVLEVDRPVINYATAVNNIQAPAYHRLNIGYARETKRANRSSVLRAGVFNAYNHKNVFILTDGADYYGFEENSETVNSSLNLKKNTFLPILPYISYEITF